MSEKKKLSSMKVRQLLVKAMRQSKVIQVSTAGGLVNLFAGFGFLVCGFYFNDVLLGLSGLCLTACSANLLQVLNAYQQLREFFITENE